MRERERERERERDPVYVTARVLAEEPVFVVSVGGGGGGVRGP
jgi:hypothetical protein